jgi:hypothetical protein
VKEYVRDLSEFMQVVRRTGSVEFGLRSAVRHGGSAKLLLASSGLTQEEVARLEDAARARGAVLVHYAELSPAELGRAAGRRAPGQGAGGHRAGRCGPGQIPGIPEGPGGVRRCQGDPRR